jgi:hypothetical protein
MREFEGGPGYWAFPRGCKPALRIEAGLPSGALRTRVVTALERR